MKKDEIQGLIDNYLLWLRDKTILKEIKEKWVQITTPHLDRNNDCLQIYVKKGEGGYLLTDDGYIIGDLINSGCSLDTPKRQELLRTTVLGFGVQQDGEQLCTKATADNFCLKKHNLIQTMLAVNDLFFLSSPIISSLFYEDVVAWLDLNDVRYTPKVKFSGKSGYDHMFDFVIPKSKSEPERVLQTMNSPRKDTAEALVFKWIDTRETRSENSRLYAFMNDRDHGVSLSVKDALKNYEIETYEWSERDRLKELLIV